MPFAVHSRTQPDVSELDPTVYVLEDGAGGRAEIWPALGFNCYRWQVQRDGQALELLYQAPDLFLSGLLRCNVIRQDHARVPIFQDKIVCIHLDINDRTVAFQMPPDIPVGSFTYGCKIVKQDGNVFLGTDIRERHREKIVARITIVAHRGIVDCQESQGLEIKYPHR